MRASALTKAFFKRKAMDGWVKLYRKLTESALWTSEPFTKGQAWVDLIAMANHKDERVYINGNWVEIKRGQLHTSELKLAARWRWSKNKVTRFLEVLRLDGMLDKICSKGGLTNGTTLTLVNYSIYQGGDTTVETTNDTTNGQRTIQRLEHKQEYKECKEEKNSSNNPHTPLKGEGDKTAPKFNASDFIRNEPEETRRILQTWIDFKKKQFNEAYKTEVGFKAFITKLNRLSGNDPEKAAAIIEQSMANNWKGIYELKNTNSNGNNKIDFDRICELSDAMLNYERQ